MFYDDSNLENAMAHFFEEPIVYNAIFAKALGSTKAAILFDHILKLNSLSLPFPTQADIETELCFSSYEAKSTLAKLQQSKVITSEAGQMSIDPFYFDRLTELAEGNFLNDGEMVTDLLISVEINRLHVKTIKAAGGSINSAILLSFLIESTQYSSVVGGFTDWYESNDGAWVRQSGMSEKEIRNAKQALRNLKLIELRQTGFPARMQYRLNMQVLSDMTWKYTEAHEIIEQRNSSRTNGVYAAASAWA